MATRRKIFPSIGKRRTPKVEIIPMVDVMFLLLVFYILSSLACTSSEVSRWICRRLRPAQRRPKKKRWC